MKKVVLMDKELGYLTKVEEGFFVFSKEKKAALEMDIKEALDFKIVNDIDLEVI